MGRFVGLLALWIAAVALVVVVALVPDVDASGYQGAGSVAVLIVALLPVLGLGPRWGALYVALWAGAAFNAGAWVIGAFTTVLLLVLLVIASGQLNEEAERRRTEAARRAQPPSLGELRAARGEVQTMIDEDRGGGGTGDLEKLRDHFDEEIRQRELDQQLRGG